MFEPIETHRLNGGTQKIFRFDNGRGASVVKHSFSYGHEQGLWELAVVKFYGHGVDQFNIDYDTPITDDVQGYLSDDEVQGILAEIKAMPAV